ncbi:hypothetical protein [Pedobacter roseus]|uniref:Uncharacterized protein n=1 Tax=Pedobacter roseus TaxID=336820 RepID=A0A7G9QMB7_9SPHI|nr:hypothetical protein [Pedobacter roseus]QNN44492.1 hypothetical protein H9L23_10635 [Pedobacter roseus]
MKSNYDRVTDINNYKMYVLYGSTLITLLLTVNEKIEFTKNYPWALDYISVVIAINLMLIVLYLILDFRATYVFSRAERTRTLQYLDNSFDTNFAGRKVEGYFSQDTLNAGFYKLSVNCFENIFHTFSIAKEMQFKTYFKAGVVIIVFMFSSAVGDKGLVRSLIEAILPLTLLQDGIKLALFISRLESLLDNFKSFFTSIKTAGFENKEPEAMRYVIEYETTLSWASIPMDSSIFKLFQSQLAIDWDELKSEYNIID